MSSNNKRMENYKKNQHRKNENFSFPLRVNQQLKKKVRVAQRDNKEEWNALTRKVEKTAGKSKKATKT